MSKVSSNSRFLLLASVIALAGCGSAVTRDISYDPLEGLNRVTHGMNKTADAVALRPASSVYAAVTPDIVERSVYNFSENLDHPLRVVNSVLQGRPYDAGRNFTRFLVNSTFGLGGYADVCTCPLSSILGLLKHPLTDIGLAKFLADHKKAND